MTPHPYQERSIEHLLGVLGRVGAAVDASDCGVGKTLVAVEVMRRRGNPATLVVCPKSTIPGWKRTAEAQGVELDASNYEMLRTGRTPYGTWHGERFRWHPGIQFLVFDEVHRCKGYLTKNSEMLKAAARQRIHTLALSATMADTPLEMDALGFVLRVHDSDSPPTLRNPEPVHFLQWARGFGVTCSAGQPPEFDRNPEHMARLHKLLFPARGVRVRIAELGDLFPETQITAELFDIDEPGRLDALYAEMAEAMSALKARTSCYGKDPLAQLSAAQQEAEMLKVPILVEQTQDAIEQGLSVALFVNFRRTLDELCRRLDITARIDGSQVGEKGAREREAARAAFQRDETRIIGCIGQAGGVGLDLHDVRGVYPRLSLICPGWDAKLIRQIVGRVHRSGGKSKSLQRFIFVNGTIEEDIFRSVSGKLSCLDALTDGDLTPKFFQNPVVAGTP